MFFLMAAAATAAVVGQIVTWDDANQATVRTRAKNRALAKNLHQGRGSEPVTALPEFLVVEHPAFGCPVVMTGREVIWWQTEGLPARDTEKTARKLRYVFEQQGLRMSLVEAGRASIA